MKGQAGFWDFERSLEALSAEGDPLEQLERTVRFEQFRPALTKAVRRSDPSKGGRPGFDVVLKFKMLVLQGLYGLSLQQTSFQVRDRLTWLRFCGLRPGDAVPDANTLWDFREALIKTKALERLFSKLDQAISDAGYLAMGGQIIDATLVAAPKQRNSDGEKEAIKAGQIPEEWTDKPAKLRQKDRDARWMVKFAKANALRGLAGLLARRQRGLHRGIQFARLHGVDDGLDRRHQLVLGPDLNGVLVLAQRKHGGKRPLSAAVSPA
ncbi:transposase [Magnetospirillum sp. SS-4]|uniref:transposase n=1 Tax=Magnetospirillum sp. SS-4 TaxID=2681465 RepID=UPI0013851C6F